MKSRMRENRKSGSERGEAREGTPLLDLRRMVALV